MYGKCLYLQLLHLFCQSSYVFFFCCVFYFYGIGSCLHRLDTLKTCQLEDRESMRTKKKWRLAEGPHGKISTSRKYLGKSEDLCLAKNVGVFYTNTLELSCFFVWLGPAFKMNKWNIDASAKKNYSNWPHTVSVSRGLGTECSQDDLFKNRRIEVNVYSRRHHIIHYSMYLMYTQLLKSWRFCDFVSSPLGGAFW